MVSWFKLLWQKKLIRILCGLTLVSVIILALPLGSAYKHHLSRALYDRHGQLIRVWLNDQQQFRFPPHHTLSLKYRKAVFLFEDHRFMWHPGIDPLALTRAIYHHFTQGPRSGASTLTMQVARLQNPRPRTLISKIIEAVVALRLEWHWSKDRIFSEYASLVPMGGNLVGVEAASWRFFNHSPEQMTWAEAALLAVLPNQPTSLNLTLERKQSREKLLAKRNRLLERLHIQGEIDSISLELSKAEPLPNDRGSFEFLAPHYAEHTINTHHAQTIIGTLDLGIQQVAERCANQQLRRLEPLGVRNIAVLVMNTQTGHVRAYVGSENWNDTLALGRNNGVTSPRSTGSLLKPFLYALALQRGPWTPQSLLEDYPTWFGSFSPQNADQQYSGLVPMSQALARSLNIPAVRLLSEYGLNDFYSWLKSNGLKHLFRPAERYGLPLVIGGAEASLFELVPLYASLMTDGQPITPKLALKNPGDTLTQLDLGEPILHPGSAWLVADMLTSVQRPDIDQYHEWLDHQVPVAWKTGTSFGARDAWAIGSNAQWTIGVWVGNFEGGSIEGLSGAQSAAPLLFALFNDLTDRNKATWNNAPNHKLRAIEICPISGDLAGADCPTPVVQLVPDGPRGAKPCPIHSHIIIDRHSQHEVCSRCWNLNDTVWTAVTRYAPQAQPFLKQRGKGATATFSHNPKCTAPMQKASFRLIYPEQGSLIYLPTNFIGQRQHLVAEAVHSDSTLQLFWYVDGKPYPPTRPPHRVALNLSPGFHEITVQDASGALQKSKFQIGQR